MDLSSFLKTIGFKIILIDFEKLSKEIRGGLKLSNIGKTLDKKLKFCVKDLIF